MSDELAAEQAKGLEGAREITPAGRLASSPRARATAPWQTHAHHAARHASVGAFERVASVGCGGEFICIVEFAAHIADAARQRREGEGEDDIHVFSQPTAR